MTGVPPEPRPAVLSVLSRMLRVRCPACGEGRIFEHSLRSPLRFRGARRCSECDWWLERGPGHWIGGTEINIVATYVLAVPLFTAVVLVFGLSALTLGATAIFTASFPFAAYRHSRALFFALDYLIDPTADPSESGDPGDDGDGRDRGGRDRPEPDAPLPPPSAPPPSPTERGADEALRPRPWVRPPRPRRLEPVLPG